MSEKTNRRVNLTALTKPADDPAAPFMRMSVSVSTEDEGERVSSVDLDLDFREQQGVDLAAWILLHLPDPAAAFAAMWTAVKQRADLQERIASMRSTDDGAEDAGAEVKS